MAQPRKRAARSGTKSPSGVVCHHESGTSVAMLSPIRKAREAMQLTQEDVERRTGLSQAAVSKIEHMGRDNGGVTITTARLLSDLLDSPLDVLFPRTGGGR